jgi:large subunit ribosomal protein L6
MSRIGNLPIEIPNGVKVAVNGATVSVEGPKGKLRQDFRSEVTVEVNDDELTVARKDDSKNSKSFHGLYRSILGNMIQGVTQGFQKTLLINGVGYRAEVNGKILVLNLGYSNPVEFLIDDGLDIAVENNTRITVSGIDKQLVGQACAEIRSVRPPEPYKGKGVKYDTENVRRKIGKAGIK